MVTGAAVVGMALVALGMVLIPGPNMIYLVSRSVSQGPKAGLVSLAGTFVGFLVYMTMANFGLAAVFIYVPALYIGVKAAGAGYLLFLAWRMLRRGGVSLFEPRALPRDSRWKLFRMGLVTNLLNPKAAIIYLALIPQFVDRSDGNVIAQGFILGGIQVGVSMIVNSIIILLAGAVSVFLRSRPSWLSWQRWVTGTLLGLVGIRLAFEAPAAA